MKRKKTRQCPHMLLWDRREQRRFVDAVEHLATLIGDLESILAEPKRRAEAAAATRAARAALQASCDNGTSAPGGKPAELTFAEVLNDCPLNFVSEDERAVLKRAAEIVASFSRPIDI